MQACYFAPDSGQARKFSRLIAAKQVVIGTNERQKIRRWQIRSEDAVKSRPVEEDAVRAVARE